MSLEPVSKEAAVKEKIFAASDPVEAAPAGNVSFGKTEGPKPEAYPVRWLRAHHALSRAEANTIAAELGWLEAA